MMKTCHRLVLVVLLGVTAGVNAQEASDSSLGRGPGASSNRPDDPPDWLFPIDNLDRSLPSWIHIDGQFRNRPEDDRECRRSGRLTLT